MRLTATTFVAQVRKSPDVTETDGVAYTGENKFHFIRPVKPPRLPIIAGIVRVQIVIAGARRNVILETAKMQRTTSSFYITNVAGARTKDIYSVECERKIERAPRKMLRVMTV